jgi:hypothetical protein
MQIGGLLSTVGNADLDQQVVRRRLRVFDEHVKITVLIENLGIEQFVFGAASLSS